MSATFSPKQIIRCPFCNDSGRPAHVGKGVLVCECCGQTFRVVMASKNTGKKLQAIVKETVQWGPNR